MTVYAPGTQERDPQKQNMALQQHAGQIDAANANIATNTANTATNTANIATNTANIATNTADISAIKSAWTPYTPTVTAQSGTITTSSATGRYKQDGKTIIVQLDITITTAGTGSFGLIATLPVTAAANVYVGTAYEHASSGKSGAAVIGNISATQIYARDASGATFIANGAQVAMTAIYEST